MIGAKSFLPAAEVVPVELLCFASFDVRSAFGWHRVCQIEEVYGSVELCMGVSFHTWSILLPNFLLTPRGWRGGSTSGSA